MIELSRNEFVKSMIAAAGYPAAGRSVLGQMTGIWNIVTGGM